VAKWILEPGHTAAEFCARHMMVTWVRGHFKNIQGTLFFDPANPGATSVEVTIDANGIWSGEPDRDAHLRVRTFWTPRTILRFFSKGVKSSLSAQMMPL
jgi:polyisoprenoid-binding protein YceI